MHSANKLGSTNDGNLTAIGGLHQTYHVILSLMACIAVTTCSEQLLEHCLNCHFCGDQNFACILYNSIVLK